MSRKADGPRIFKRGAHYYVEYVEGNEILIPRQSLRTKDAGKARAAASRLILEYEERGYTPEGNELLFRDAAAAYLKHGMSNLAGTTQDDHRNHLRLGGILDRAFGDIPISQLTDESLLRWWEESIEGKRATSTGRRYLDSVSAIMRRARRHRLIAHNPVVDFQAIIREENKTKKGRALSEAGKHVRPIEDPAEIERILASAREESLEDHVLVLLMLDAGLRIGEAMQIRWRAVNWGEDENDLGRSLEISESNPRGMYPGDPPKSGRTRYVDLSRRLRRVLMELYTQEFRPSPDRVIVPRDQGNWRQRQWRRILARAGTTRAWRPKDLRDTFASQLLSNGQELVHIADQLGHSSVGVTESHYTKYIRRKRYQPTPPLAYGELPTDVLARLGAPNKRPQSGHSGFSDQHAPGDIAETVSNVATFHGERGRDRTGDRRIKSPLLCQLSYAPGRTIAARLLSAKTQA